MSVVPPPLGGARGSDRSPATATPPPTVTAGPTVSTVVTTGLLSGPGVTPPVFVTRETLDDALKVVNDRMDANFDKVLKLLKGKQTATASDSPAPNLDDTFVSREEFGRTVVGLNTLINESTEKLLTNQTVIIQNQSILMDSLTLLHERVSALENTCRADAERPKRKFDDQDDPEPDHQKGEKRPRTSGSEPLLITWPSTSTTQGQTSTQKDTEPTGSDTGAPTSSLNLNLQLTPYMLTDQSLIGLQVQDVHPPMTVEKPEETEPIFDPDTFLTDPLNFERTEDYSDSIFNLTDSEDEADPTSVQTSNPDTRSEAQKADDDRFANDLFHGEQVQEETSEEARLRIEKEVEALFEDTPEEKQPDAPPVPEAGPSTPHTEKAGPSSTAPPSVQAHWERVRIRTAFLEDVEEIYVKKRKPLNPARVLRVLGSTEFQREYVHLFTHKRLPVEQVRSNHYILRIVDVKSDFLWLIEYPIYHVLRDDGKIYVFSEADLPNLHLVDLEFMYNMFRNMEIRPPSYVLGLEAVKKHMRRKVFFESCHDFQLAVESNQQKVNLTKPNQTLEGIEDMPVYKILEQPELGIVYQSTDGKKKFLRISELAKYSDGTLKVIKRQLDEVLTRERNRKTTMFSKSWQRDEKRIFMDIFNALDDKLNLRRKIRGFEQLLGIRRSLRWNK